MRTIRGVIVTILAAGFAAATPAALAATPARPHTAPIQRRAQAAPALARPHAAPAPAQLAAVSFTSPRRGYGLFTAQHGGRCTAAVGATSDGGRRFTRPALVTTWPCARSAPAETLTAGDRGDVFWSGPALFTSQDGGRSWSRARPGGPVLALATAGRSAWALVARCRGRGQASDRCPLRLIVSANGGRIWHAARHQPVGASVTGYGHQPVGQAELVRAGAATAYVLTGPDPDPSGRGTDARLWATRDGGASWARHAVPCGLDGLSAALAVAPDGTIFVACAGEPSAGAQAKSLAWSVNGGRTWTVHRPCRPGDLCPPLGLGYLGQIAASSSSTLFLTGPRSSLLVTGDGGRAWHLVRPIIGDSGGGTGTIAFFGPAGRTGADPTGLVFGYDARHGERPAIWHTSDGGAHWQVVYPQAA